ncbi:hypothetical protein COCMIDRAFT_30635 [Bipolaris oryzae ATCC 44560]|uniref:Uncharacterized protein n=1 Tax=Bipolaris oryzae ATCC 44560 TaxID=930090 RepID=W6YMD5_COCMI|nr:uncharacterized protein COCMIDRAFT_30635 [Bipolaris oryzae ATCC 44560]EUC40437.1 hypothetical protein COCMIDRAFT_30635 [Bipolaris oryzae ATCC 44560]
MPKDVTWEEEEEEEEEVTMSLYIDQISVYLHFLTGLLAAAACISSVAAAPQAHQTCTYTYRLQELARLPGGYGKDWKNVQSGLCGKFGGGWDSNSGFCSISKSLSDKIFHFDVKPDPEKQGLKPITVRAKYLDVFPPSCK